MKFSIWDFLSILLVLGIIGVVFLVGTLFSSPTSPLNPFPPATDVPIVVVPTSTPTIISLPPTWTPTVGPGVDLVPSATPKATNTPIASRTPFILPTPTPQPTVFLPTVDSVPLVGKCRIVSQSPKDGTAFKPGSEFTTDWVIENTSDNAWGKDNVDVRYLSGDKMQKNGSIVDLPQSVAPNQSIEITITMLAPLAEGVHTTYWNFTSGSTVLCTFYVQIMTSN